MVLNDWPLAQKKRVTEHRLGGTEFYNCISGGTKMGMEVEHLTMVGIVESDAIGVPYTGQVGTHIDMTQQKETEHKLPRVAYCTCKDGTSSFSHDLRGPTGSFMQVI